MRSSITAAKNTKDQIHGDLPEDCNCHELYDNFDNNNNSNAKFNNSSKNTKDQIHGDLPEDYSCHELYGNVDNNNNNNSDNNKPNIRNSNRNTK